MVDVFQIGEPVQAFLNCFASVYYDLSGEDKGGQEPLLTAALSGWESEWQDVVFVATRLAESVFQFGG